jgi:serine/threonine-protein kinase ATR
MSSLNAHPCRPTRKKPRLALSREIGKSWLASAKIARKAKQWQTAYSAVLQAQKSKVSYSFIESAKLLKASGEPLRALNELENSIKHLGLFDDQVLDLTADSDSNRMKAKVSCLFFVTKK